jgi:hypothetical protein
MSRTTLSTIKASRIPASLGICATDPRLVAWVNEAQERLLFEGKWWGTVARFQLCATNGCITLPNQIAVLEAVNVCGQPTELRDFWYEFLENGYGSVSPASCSTSQNCCGRLGPSCSKGIYRGQYPSFDDIIGTNKKLNLICDLSTDVGKKVLVLGYDQNGNWIRTMQSGSYADGELVSLAQSAGTTTTNFFSTIAGIQFIDQRDGQVWLYEYNNDTTLKRLIGSYARYLFSNLCANQNNDGSCNKIKVEAVGKLEMIPVKADTDYLIIGNIPALKEMCKAIKNSENEPDGEKANNIILKGMAVASAILDKELEHRLGSGRRIGISVVGSSLGKVDPVLNFL